MIECLWMPPTKQFVSLRIDKDILEKFQAANPGLAESY